MTKLVKLEYLRLYLSVLLPKQQKNTYIPLGLDTQYK